MFKTKRKAASLSKPLGASKKPKSAKLPDNPVPAAAGAFPIVGLGASAGGLEAFEQFLKNVPSPSGMAFVIVLHLDPTHKGIIPELLQRMTKMKVFQVKDRMPVRPDCVYVIPPNKDLSILHGVLHLLNPAAPRGLRLPIDFFLRSLAEDQRERSVGVILSGMGSDGTLGLKAIKEQAGVVLVQEPASAKFDGMPRSAIDAGLADIVAPAEELARLFSGRQPALGRCAVAHRRKAARCGGLFRRLGLESGKSDPQRHGNPQRVPGTAHPRRRTGAPLGWAGAGGARAQCALFEFERT